MTDPAAVPERSGLHLVEAGSGPDLLCLHGIGSCAESFRPQLDGLAGTAHVIAWDAPGYGRSADPESEVDITGFADAAADVIRSRASGSAHLLGVSWGGVIAQALALRHPGLVRSLVLADSSRGSGRTPAGAVKMRARAAELAELGPEEFARRRAPRLLSEQAPPELVERAIAIMTGALRLPGYRYAVEAMADADTSPRLAEIRVPTLVLCGDRDRVTGIPESRALADGIPGAVFETISGAGHLANQERPESFNARVSSHIDAVESLRDDQAV
ncbi:alpha/beta fold hydrolase [Saccharopolyspora sp. WRP15-2]|uniref:Alpha/beta fold hydrolase n=1 Tax=Saccharopolyspora oryzae TaxID=2997343 RepID=A0ABT4VAR9_9PSEU|nr:alpha/beta fold hydrolase [Saccharopolyspora oryzae]MDA3631048.1 alpha/beta fold hydrolase [Saccharopolyspora oryzae]